jgi:hypothetical protein
MASTITTAVGYLVLRLATGIVLVLTIGLGLNRSGFLKVPASSAQRNLPSKVYDDLGDLGRLEVPPAGKLPLRVAKDGRHFVDAQEAPVLVIGDTAWSLIAQLDEDGIGHYLRDRQKKGFNAIIVNLIEHKFCTAPPGTKAGLVPFRTAGDFSTPNTAYFDFAHEVVKSANDRGIVVWLAPAYLGYDGGDEGWFREMKNNGRAALRKYGRFLGERFNDLPNIVWILGGDYAPPARDRWVVTEVAEGIREKDRIHLMTAHGRRNDRPIAAFGNPGWIDINANYSREESLLASLRADFQSAPTRPFVLIEATYENEHDAKPDLLRRQAYWALLSGAGGQFFGNSPIWHFDGPGVFQPSTTWQKALDQQGSWDMIRLRNAFVGSPWHQLVPDLDHKVVTEGYGKDLATAATALTADGKLALTYIPSTGTDSRSLTIDLAQFAGPVSARWYNPTNGRYVPMESSPFANQGSRQWRTPGDNSTGCNDWLLVMEVH